MAQIFARQNLAITQVVSNAFGYFRRCQRDAGYLAEDPEKLYLNAWDSVNALKAVALWRDTVPCGEAGVVSGVLEFLRSAETSSGMIGWGASEVGPDHYCAETSSEYITALALLGRRAEAHSKAAFLRGEQLPSGPWEEVYPHIPHALQTVPSVTGFALLALASVDLEPVHPDEALTFLVGSQADAGHFGLNAYYCATHYYILRPVVPVLMEFGYYAAVARARDFVLARQRDDGSWFSTTEGYEAFSSPELHTALALETLAHAGVVPDEPAVRRGVSWLLGQQRADGSWYGGSYAMPASDSYRELRRPQDLYATSQALSALKHLEIVGAS